MFYLYLDPPSTTSCSTQTILGARGAGHSLVNGSGVARTHPCPNASGVAGDALNMQPRLTVILVTQLDEPKRVGMKARSVGYCRIRRYIPDAYQTSGELRPTTLLSERSAKGSSETCESAQRTCHRDHGGCMARRSCCRHWAREA
ncbi:hypothetical protein A0H81_08802 [Grifola frondosa]|uniref:Uncharacterized protein n=1 Tax=Grifola frondosa TaxID=5627 RepID=A0A1C7M4W1_GRIFR|nr:hypothetical protein A0H81_08802 [Grifola frondosa]